MILKRSEKVLNLSGKILGGPWIGMMSRARALNLSTWLACRKCKCTCTCTFLDLWMEEPTFKDWLRPVVGNNREAYRNICKKTIHITWMEVKAVKSHMDSASHQARMLGRSLQLTLSLFCTGSSATSATSTLSSSTSTAPSTSSAPGQSSADTTSINTFCNTTATLPAEVLWCLPANVGKF